MTRPFSVEKSDSQAPLVFKGTLEVAPGVLLEETVWKHGGIRLKSLDLITGEDRKDLIGGENQLLGLLAEALNRAYERGGREASGGTDGGS